MNFYQTTRHNIPESCHRHTHRRENLKSHYIHHILRGIKFGKIFNKCVTRSVQNYKTDPSAFQTWAHFYASVMCSYFSGERLWAQCVELCMGILPWNEGTAEQHMAIMSALLPLPCCTSFLSLPPPTPNNSNKLSVSSWAVFLTFPCVSKLESTAHWSQNHVKLRARINFVPIILYKCHPTRLPLHLKTTLNWVCVECL
jgi:hypothetical protein